MKTSIVFFLIVIEFSFIFGQNNSSENVKPGSVLPEIMPNDEEIHLEFKTMEKNSNFYDHQRKPNHLLIPDQKLITDPRSHYAQFVDSSPAIPQFGFSAFENKERNIYLSDHTGRNNLKLENFQPKEPLNFPAALKAISARIINERNNEKYIPYPPNDDPFNYSGYSGHFHATEPSTVRNYERAIIPNYGVQSVNFDQPNLRRVFPNSDYQTSFSNEFKNPELSFYTNPDFFNNGFYPQLRRNYEPVYKSQIYEENNGRPVK